MSGRFYKLNQGLAARRDITPTAKVLYAVLANRIGKNGVCWAGVRRLAADCGCSEHAVLRATAALEAASLLRVERRGNGQSNLYRLNDEPVAEVDTLPQKQALSIRPRGVVETAAEAVLKRQHNKREPTKIKESARRTVAAVGIPVALDTEGFRQAWGDWLAFRKQARFPTPEATARAQLKKLAEVGPIKAVRMIEASIANGWRGLFPPKGTFTPAPTTDTSVYAQVGKKYE